MADQIYSMCWPTPSQPSQYQNDPEQAAFNEHPRPPVTSANLLESNSHEAVSMATDSNASMAQDSNCKRPGYCVNGKPISLGHLEQHGLEIEVPSGLILAGAKSPLLGKMLLVTAVNKRFLPCDSTAPTTLGFSGCCVGCGEAHFRYFTEFATHINLVLATQPKKQKHLKFYIVKDNLGRLCRGPRILWRGIYTPRKRTFPYPGYQSPMDSNASSHKFPDVSSTSYSSMIGGSHNPIREGRSSTSSQSSCDSGSSFDPSVTPPVYKRSRDDLDGKEEELYPRHHAWLETVCGVRPVLILGYPNTTPHFISSYKEIIISHMLLECFEFLKRPSSTSRQLINRPFQAPPHGSHQTRGTFNHPADIRPAGSPSSGFTLPQLSANVVIILIAQYLSTLPENATICKDEIHNLIQNSKELFWQTHQENSTIQPFFLTIDSTNLVHFTSVATLPSRGSVKLVSSVLSLNDAISKGLGFLYQISKHNQHRETKLQVPHYLLLISSPPAQSPEFCILVTGVNQSKFIQERLINEHSLTSIQFDECVSSLNRAYQMVNAAIDNLLRQLEQSMAKTKLVFLPFNGSPILKASEKEAACMLPKTSLGTSFRTPEFELHAPQVASAHHLLSCVLTSKDGAPSYDLRHFSSLEFSIVIPPSQSYFHQILHQVEKSNVLVELGLSPPTQSKDAGFSTDRMIQNNGSEETKQRMRDFLSNAKSCQDVLFVLVCDEAHRYFTPEIATSLPYFQELSRLPNTLIILVTPVPYLFETCQSRIRPDNEVFWSDPGNFLGPVSISDQKLLRNQENLVHFGMPEYIETIAWTHQIPLIREDDEFEGMVLRANVLSTVPSCIVRCYVLIHHYTTAIMWSAGMRSIEPHCTFKTLQVVRDIIECPLLSTVGRGAMLVIRIPNHILASWAYSKLKDIRDRVGFQYRFAIIHDDGETGLEIEEHFLHRLRSWRKSKVADGTSNADWYPTCYDDLLDLPCIVVVSGKERNGDTFPRSLKYCDFRLLDEHCSFRSNLELEFNAVSRYINSGLGNQASTRGSNSAHSSDYGREFHNIEAESENRNQFCSSYPLPVLLVSRAAYSILKKDFFGCPKNLSLSPDPATAWNSEQRPALVSGLPSEQSKYYRRWTKPRENFSRMGKDKTFLDTSPMKFYPACFLFSGPPQVGKISAVLHFIQLLHNTLQKLQRVDVHDEVPDSLPAPEEIPASEMDQPSYKILSKIPFNSTLVGSRFSAVSPIHQNSDKYRKKNESKLTNGRTDLNNHVIHNDVNKDPPTSSVMMSPFAAYDSYHHCDDCKNYREGLGPSLFTKHVITLSSGEQLTFIIPSSRREWFVFNEQNELQTLKLPIVSRKSISEGWKIASRHSARVLKSPVFMPTIGRAEQGLLNLYHAMEGREGVHVIFVKNNELTLYQKIWPNHVIVALPQSCNYQGLGMIKDIIKEFATQNLLAERQRQQCEIVSNNTIWPFIHIIEDSCVMWQNFTVDHSNNLDEDDRGKSGDWSLLRTMQLVESSPHITSFALIGFNHWGTGSEKKYKLNSYSVCHVHSSLFLNISTTHHVTYNRRLFSWEQVDFNLKLSAHGAVILRYNHMSVLTKYIPVGGGSHYDVTPYIEDIISVPDRDPGHVIPIPAHYLLEEYLKLKSAEKIFPAANQNAANPVLLLDCFVNLGPGLTVDCCNTSCPEREATGSNQYGGLLLYLCNGCHVTRELLRGFQFCPGAKICVVSSDRSTLRDNVVKLDLEEHWRFRLRDEFKTAGSLGDGALYFLTGTYDG